MSIALLYESDEWSNCHLGELLARAVPTERINLALDCPATLPGEYDLYVNRVFPSARGRGGGSVLAATDRLLEAIGQQGGIVINSLAAWRADCSKYHSCQRLARAAVAVPPTRRYARPGQIRGGDLAFPCVLKPDCGGRSMDTYILRDADQLEGVLERIPPVPVVIQRYVQPCRDFTVRVEIVGSEVIMVFRRSVEPFGVGSYHAGSKFERYDNCPEAVLDMARAALKALEIEMGSLDIIETAGEGCFVIDVNATSNFTADYLDWLGFDPIEKMADYILMRHRQLIT